MKTKKNKRTADEVNALKKVLKNFTKGKSNEGLLALTLEDLVRHILEAGYRKGRKRED